MIRVAIFSDIHGKILLPFKMVDAYQKEYHKKIDLIIQCGDVGIYPNLDNLDNATKKHAKHDRDELGFHDDFIHIDQKIEAFLTALNVKMICVRGNHEDHDFLDDLEKQYAENSLFPVDSYQYVWLCKSGELQNFQKDHEYLSFLGFGRIGDRKNRTEKRFIQKYEYDKIKKLVNHRDLIDLFITHDSDNSGDPGYGSKEIREILDHIPFQYHFFGHTGKPYSSELDLNGITTSIKVKELEFNDLGTLPENCMLILEKENDKIQVNPVPLSFTNLFTKHTWNHK